MQNKAHILLIDDDPEICQLLSEFLQQFHYKITCIKDGLNLKRTLKNQVFDIVLLDIMLPNIDGFALCKTIREHSDVPIIIISALDSEHDRILGLEIGADDYVPKPFNTRELLARIKALLRRSFGEWASSNKKLTQIPKIKFSNWLLDRNSHTLINENKISIPLSSKEFHLLMVFLDHPQRILTRDQLADLLYDKELDPFDRSIDVLIGRLRKKIEADPKAPQLLITARGSGYQFIAEIKNEDE